MLLILDLRRDTGIQKQDFISLIKMEKVLQELLDMLVSTLT